MRKTVMVLLVLVMAASTARAGVPELAVKGGVNIANVSMNGFEADSRSSFLFGFSIDVGNVFTENLHFQGELLWSHKGFKNGRAEGDTLGVDLNTSYFQIPLLLAYHFPVAGTVKPRIYAGPTFNYNSTAKAKGSEDNDFVDVSTHFNEITWGLAVGVAVRVATIDFIARYEWGLTKMTEMGWMEDPPDAEAYDRTLGLMIGFPFMAPGF
jgi:hypothetical protein